MGGGGGGGGDGTKCEVEVTGGLKLVVGCVEG